MSDHDDRAEAEDPGLDRIVFVAVCHGARERVVVEGEKTVKDLGLAFLPEGPPQLAPGDSDAFDTLPFALGSAENGKPAWAPPRTSPYEPGPEWARTAEEACDAEYEYPRFGTLTWKGTCSKKKGHAGGPPPRKGHGGEEKC